MQKQIQNVLETFEPIFSIHNQNHGDTPKVVIAFDSNFRNDLNREAKTETISTAEGLSFKLEKPVLQETDPDGMQFVSANILMTVAGQQKKLHTLLLALPAISKNKDGSYNYLSLLDIQMTLSDKVVDSAASALEDYVAGRTSSNKQTVSNDVRRKADALNVWNKPGHETTTSTKPTLWSVIRSLKRWQKIAGGIVAVGLAAIVILPTADMLTKPTAADPSNIAEMQISPETTNAQVALTRETLKQMGLDPSKVQSDLGCLAQ